MKTRWIICFTAVVTLTACTAVPKVELSKIKSPSDLRGDEFDSFYLQRSILRIDKSGTKKNAEDKEIDDIAVNSIPSEFTGFKIAVRRADSPGVKTNLNITKRPNTDLISEAGTEVIDKRAELIAKVGGIISKVVAVPFREEKGLEPGNLPKVIPVDVLITANKVGREGKTDIEAAEGVKIDFGAIPPDAESIEKLLPNSEVTSSLVYSACRQATIRFKYKENNYSQSVKVADPNFFERVGFPIKGKISFHSECGVSVTSEKDTGVSSSADIIDALATQGKAIKDAIDASKKENATTSNK